GAQVVAVDVSPQAVRCARANAEANGLGQRLGGLEGDLFTPLAGRGPFDPVLWDPPVYRGGPRNPGGRARDARPRYRVHPGFAAGVPDLLTAQGRVVLVLSSDVELSRVRELFTARGLATRALRTERGLFETLSLEEFRRP